MLSQMNLHGQKDFSLLEQYKWSLVPDAVMISAINFNSLEFKDGIMSIGGGREVKPMTYTIEESILTMQMEESGSVTFGRIDTITPYYFSLNMINGETGQIVEGFQLLFRSDKPTDLSLSAESYKELSTQSEWGLMFKGDEWNLRISNDPKPGKTFSLVKEDNSCFLVSVKLKLPVIYLSQNKITLMGLPTGGPHSFVREK